MEYIYTSFVFLISIIEATLFYHVVCRKKIREISFQTIIPFVALYVVQMVIVGVQLRGWPQYILIAVLYYLVGVMFTETGWIHSILCWLLCFLLSATLEDVIHLCIWRRFVPRTQGYGVGNIYTCITVTLILYIMNRILCKRLDDGENDSPRVFGVLAPSVCGIVFGISYMIYAMEQIDHEGQKILALLVLFVSVLGIAIVVIIILHISQQKEYYRLQADLENLYNQQQKAYFSLLLEKQEETKRFRHDILNHLLCIQEYIKKEHYSDAESYLNSVLNEIKTIREMQYDVGNEVVNVLLNYYLLPIREQCDVSIEGYLGKLEKISQMDLCTIVSNLLKNAVEAVDSGGEIVVHIIRKEKYAQIEISNSCKNTLQVDNTGKIETSKLDKENHGYGISNVKKAVQKNHGEFQYDIEEHRFCVELVLPV